MSEASGFVFDDAVLQPSGIETARPGPLHLDETYDRPQGVGLASRSPRGRRARRRGQAPPSPGALPVKPHADDAVSSRGLPLALACFGSALLLLGLLFFGLQRENLGLDPLAQWRSPPSSPPPGSPAPAAGLHTSLAAAGAAPAVNASDAQGVQRIAVPAVPGPLADHRPTPAPRVKTPVAAPVRSGETAQQQPSVAAAVTSPAGEEVDEEALFALVEEYRQLGDARSAEQLLQRLFREGRQQGRAALALGDLYLERERFAEAREMFELSEELYHETDPTHAARVSRGRRP